MTTDKRPRKTGLQQCLIVRYRYSTGYTVYLETLESDQQVSRRQFPVTGDARTIALSILDSVPPRMDDGGCRHEWGPLLDYLEEFPACVAGMTPERVREAVDAVRVKGWFVR